MTMNPVSEIKRLIVRALAAAEGVPVPDSLVDTWCLDRLWPRPLLSDVHLGKRELEADGFIIGAVDDLDGGVMWTLTVKGRLRGKQL